MYRTVVLAGLVCLAAAAPAPAPQELDFAAIEAAPAPEYTQAPVSAVSQSITINSAAISASAAAAVTGVATATATTSVLQKRSVSSTSQGGVCTAASAATSSTAAASSTVKEYPTSIYTSEAGCPTPFEIGTYCGFVNPEDPCAAQPDGYGPKVTPDTVAAFESDPQFKAWSLDARTPSGYEETFKDLNASVSANSYLGLYTLTSYDVEGCSQWCDNTTLCTGFNLYIERDPSVNPTAGSCPDPSSITNFKCTLWGSGVDAAAATNYGDYREDFEVVIAGSNGYEKTNTTKPATPSGWGNSQSCSGSAHSHPQTCIGQKFFPGPYDPSVCGAYALQQNKVNSQSEKLSHRSYSNSQCNFFNAYMLTKNGRAQGTYCSLFAEQYKPEQASYVPGWNSDNFWGVESSWSFCLE